MKLLAVRLSWQTTPAKSLVMSEHVVRVPQPPDQSSNAGHRVAAVNRGGVSLITFFGRTKKVIGVRGGAAPRDFVLPPPLPNHLPQGERELLDSRHYAATLRQAQGERPYMF